MNSSPNAGQVEHLHRARVRLCLNLYQVFLLFSIATVWLLLVRVETQEKLWTAKRDKLFSLDHDLYVTNPKKIIGVHRARTRVSEPSWNIYIPNNIEASVMFMGQKIGALSAGKHLIRAYIKEKREHPYPTMLFLVFVDDVAIDISPPVAAAANEAVLKSLTEVDPGERLPLMQSQSGDEVELKLWIESAVARKGSRAGT